MADMFDPLKQRSRRPANVMVPPPPPQIAQGLANPPFLQAEQPMTDPIGAGLIPPAPNVPMPASFMAGPAPLPAPTAATDPKFLQGLEESVGKTATLADELSQRAHQFKDEPVAESIHQSPFEQMMNDTIQQKMLNLLSGKETAGERFGKGFDLGQKIASSVAVPLLGAFSKGGQGIGIAEAGNHLRQQAALADRERMATRHANNQLLMQLATQWENMSPDSSKNMLALAKQRLETAHTNAQQKNDLMRLALSASQEATQGKNMLLTARMGMSKEDWDRLVQKHSGDIADAGLAQTKTGQEFQQKAEATRLGNDQTRIGMEKDRLGLSKEDAARAEKKFTFEKGQATEANNLKKKEQEFGALKEVLSKSGALMKDSVALDANQRPKYGDLLGRVSSNPMYVGAAQELLNRAGLGGKLDAGNVLQEMMRSQAADKESAQSNPFEILGKILSSPSQIFAGSQKEALPAKSVDSPALPNAKASTLQAAHDAFVQAHGRDPSPEELLQAAKGGK